MKTSVIRRAPAPFDLNLFNPTVGSVVEVCGCRAACALVRRVSCAAHHARDIPAGDGAERRARTFWLVGSAHQVGARPGACAFASLRCRITQSDAPLRRVLLCACPCAQYYIVNFTSFEEYSEVMEKEKLRPKNSK